MNRTMIFAKLGGELLGALTSGTLAIFAAEDSTLITSGAVVALFGFAGLLVRQIVNNQKLYIGIVAGKDHDIAERDEMIRYLRWELESMRFRHGERQIDPGPYTPRVTLPASLPGAS